MVPSWDEGAVDDGDLVERPAADRCDNQQRAEGADDSVGG